MARAGAVADLVVRIASVIPTPGAALCSDDPTWRAFERLVDEAAGLLASAVGHAGVGQLQAMVTSDLSADPVPRALVERALVQLGVDAANAGSPRPGGCRAAR